MAELESFLGYYPVQITSGILDRIATLEMGILIINLIFNLVKSILIVISILIIYSLLMVSVESKNFEIAVIRMVGLEKNGIIWLVVCQSFLYVIPAIFTAFTLGILILSQISNIFETQYKIKIDKIPSLDSSAQAIFIGTIIPLLSSILPIQAALKKSLNEALDIQKSKTDAISVNILQKNKKDVTSLLVFGFIAICYGFGVYYLLPLSLISFNFQMAMTIFLFILFGMILALAILVINFMPYINSIVAFFVLNFQPKSVKLVV